MPSQTEITAIHEASHALVAAHFGLKIERATIRPKPGEYSGAVRIKEPGVLLLMVLLAGKVGERVVFGTEQGSIEQSHDWKEAIALANKMWSGPVLERLANLELAVEKLLRQNRDKLDRLSDALYRRVTLTGAEVLAIVSPSSKQSRSAVKPKAPTHPDRRLPQPGDFRTSAAGRISRVGRDLGRVVVPTGEKMYRKRTGALR
jgi:ATP-dependent Zn protease